MTLDTLFKLIAAVLAVLLVVWCKMLCKTKGVSNSLQLAATKIMALPLHCLVLIVYDDFLFETVHSDEKTEPTE